MCKSPAKVFHSDQVHLQIPSGRPYTFPIPDSQCMYSWKSYGSVKCLKELDTTSKVNSGLTVWRCLVDRAKSKRIVAILCTWGLHTCAACVGSQSTLVPSFGVRSILVRHHILLNYICKMMHVAEDGETAA